MIKYICPGYIALATWTGEVYSDKVTCDLWGEWVTVGRGSIEACLRATKGTEVGERWTGTLRINRKGPADHLLYITMFSEEGQPMYRYETPGMVFPAQYGVEVNMILGGR